MIYQPESSTLLNAETNSLCCRWLIAKRSKNQFYSLSLTHLINRVGLPTTIGAWRYIFGYDTPRTNDCFFTTFNSPAGWLHLAPIDAPFAYYCV